MKDDTDRFFSSGLQINHFAREKIESNLIFAGFLVFHCPLKPDAVESLKMLADSSHRVRIFLWFLHENSRLTRESVNETVHYDYW